MRRPDSPLCHYGSPQLDELVERVHRDLRRQRRAQAWRANAPARRKTFLALVLVIAPLLAALLYQYRDQIDFAVIGQMLSLKP